MQGTTAVQIQDELPAATERSLKTRVEELEAENSKKEERLNAQENAIRHLLTFVNALRQEFNLVEVKSSLDDDIAF